MTTATLPAPPSTRPADPRPWRWTPEQFFALAEQGHFGEKRVELIRGEIVEMSPPGWPHTVAKTKTADVLRSAFAGRGWVNEQSPMPTEDSVPLPDVAVYPGRIEDYSDHPTDPLLVVEVAATTLTNDTTTKLELYAEEGHREYWVVDVENRQLLVFRDPRPIPAGGHTYHTRLTLGPADSISPLVAPTAVIRVADLLP